MVLWFFIAHASLSLSLSASAHDVPNDSNDLLQLTLSTQNAAELSVAECESELLKLSNAQNLTLINPDTVDTISLLQFSRATHFQEVHKMFGLTEEEFSALLNQKGSFQLPKDILSASPWRLTIVPDVRFKLAAYSESTLLDQIVNKFEILPKAGVNVQRKLLESPLKSLLSSQEFRAALKNLKASLQPAFDVTDEKHVKEINRAKILSAGLCAEYGVIDLLDCHKAFKRILDFMAPDMRVSGADLIIKISENPAYFEGLRKIALKIDQSIANHTVLESRFFDDLIEAFITSGASKAEAVEYAWDTIGLYATRGAHIGSTLLKLLPPQLSPIAHYFHVIATGLSVLDSSMLEIGNFQYSLPREIKSTLDTGKPYHFWMTAYLARLGAIETGNPDAGRTAAWLAQLGYQMRSSTAGRNPARAFAVESLDQANNKIRMDLASAGAGAFYGSESVRSSISGNTFDVDEGFRYLIKNASPIQPVESMEKAEQLWNQLGGVRGYVRWKKIFRPKQLMKFYSNNANSRANRR